VGRRSGYVEFEVPNRSGATRRICAPRPKLRAAQRVLLEQVLSKIDLHPAAHGFVPGRSTVTNAAPHVNAALLVKVDLEEFFPSVHYRRVRGLFEAYGYKAEVAATLAGLTTHRAQLPDGRLAWPGALPQGAPTSPAIANIVCRRLDSRLTSLAKKFGGTYTRYADDLSFSFPTPPEKVGRFLWWVNAICQQEGFSENDPKRHVMRRSGRLAVTGLVVNERVSIPRDDRRRFKAILHNVKKHGLESQARGRKDFVAWLEGYAAYVHMVHPVLGAKWLAEVRALTKVAP
jgi:retron-type reverse transcriptase